MTPENRCVALYCRISKDRHGRMEGVDTQERWGREYAARTWPGVPIRVFKDNSLSAANDGPRPGYDALCDAIDAGQVAHVWVVEQSRLERREVGWFELAAAMDDAGIPLLHTNRDGIVAVRDEVAGIKAVLNAAEVRKMKKRVNERLAAIAEEGRPSGVTPFGFRRSADVDGKPTYAHVPEQADAIRFAAEKILAGWSLSNVASELRKRGLHGSKRRWTYDSEGRPVSSRPTEISQQTVRSMLTNHAVAGLRVHKGQVRKGVWEPILDPVTWEAVRSKLGSSRVVTRADGSSYNLTAVRRPGATARKYLLTGGLAVCGVCGAPLVASKRKRGGPTYLCNPVTGGRGCVGILADRLEQFVVDTMLEKLNTPDFLEGLKGDDESAARRDELVAALAAIDTDRQQMADLRGTGEISFEEYRQFLSGLSVREQRLRAELASVPVPVSIIDPARIAEAWSGLELGEKREALRMVIKRVTVHRARPGVQAFDPGRVTIDF